MKEAKILIVDDEEKNIKLLKGILSSESYHLFGYGYLDCRDGRL